MTGIFQTTLEPILTADQAINIRIELKNKQFVSSLIKVNDSVLDNVELSEGAISKEQTDDGEVTIHHDNSRVLYINLLPGDIVSARASISDEIRYEIEEM